MEPGRMDRRITLQRSSASTDDWNQPVLSWALISKVWAYVKDLSASEKEEEDQRVTVRRKQFTIRYMDNFSTSYRILDGTDPYYITSFSEIGRQEGLRIIAEARDND